MRVAVLEDDRSHSELVEYWLKLGGHDAHVFARAGELLNAMDSFDLAIHNASSDSAAGDNMLRGLDLIYKQFQDTLARFGLKPIEAKGQTFDPNLHQAVTTIPTDDVAENTVVDELRKGYMLNGRLLRPAMVSVAVRS